MKHSTSKPAHSSAPSDSSRTSRPDSGAAKQTHPESLPKDSREKYVPPVGNEESGQRGRTGRKLEILAHEIEVSDPDAAELIRRARDRLSGKTAALPPVESSAGLEDEKIEEAPELIEGLLRSGEVMLFAADAKMGKTWLGIELAHAVTSGGDWLGCRVMQKGAVAYLNFELQRSTFRTRLQIVCRQRGMVYPENIYQIHMRGTESTLPELTDHIRKICEATGVKLIVIDSLYNTYGDRSENDNTEMGALMREVFAMAKACGSALIALHHYSKSSGMAATDSARASGAHTLHRAPDNLTTVTRLTEEEVKWLGLDLDRIHARVTPSLRSFRDMPSFIISRPVGNWQFNRHDKPLSEMMHEAKVSRGISAKEGRPQRFDLADLCDWMGDREFRPGDLYKEAASFFGVHRDTVERRKNEGLEDGSITRLPTGLLRVTFVRRPAASAPDSSVKTENVVSQNELSDFDSGSTFLED